ncbi:MAG: hypothetical protein U9Q66_01875 [Patescibacteria group bacterium]|nr:hypothetical protein [Patescibacteria group bacterium]
MNFAIKNHSVSTVGNTLKVLIISFLNICLPNHFNHSLEFGISLIFKSCNSNSGKLDNKK